jgi:hypothetical protein
MKTQITVSSVAILALVALTNAVDARVVGGSSMSSSRLSSVNIHSNASSLGSSNGIKHMRKFNEDGQDDPPPKKTPQGGSTNGNSGSGYGSGPRFYGDYGRYGYHPHPHYGDNGPPLACKGRPC